MARIDTNLVEFANNIMQLKCNIKKEHGEMLSCVAEEIDGTEHKLIPVKRIWSYSPLRLNSFEITRTENRDKDMKSDVWLVFARKVKIRTGIAEDIKGQPPEMHVR